MNVSIRQLTGAVVVSFCVGAFITLVGSQAPATTKPGKSSNRLRHGWL
jgi:hypothetical protein